MIKTVLFDFGGVFLNLTRAVSVRRFEELGVHDADALLDPYCQTGTFLKLESGELNGEEFAQELSRTYGVEITREQAAYAIRGFVEQVEPYKFDFIDSELPSSIRKLLVSNTNELIYELADSDQFLPSGRPVSSYFERVYLSFEEKVCKPDKLIFERIIDESGIDPAQTLFIDDGPKNCEVARGLGFVTYCCENGEDWTTVLRKMLL